LWNISASSNKYSTAAAPATTKARPATKKEQKHDASFIISRHCHVMTASTATAPAASKAWPAQTNGSNSSNPVGNSVCLLLMTIRLVHEMWRWWQ
jgi:hypothetical protein